MKNLVLVLSLFLANQLNAVTLYDQLCAFNFNWKDYKSQAPKGPAVIFESDQAYVQAHLKAVLKVLKSNPTNHLNKTQRRSRRQMIHLLENYRNAGNFPKNYYREARTPVFIDEHGTHCAVSYLLQQTGHENVAKQIAATNNYAWVKDIHDPALVAWQAESGLTLDELKLIQGAYDSYLDNALFLWNRYEIPQRPTVMTAYFNEGRGLIWDGAAKEIWCLGEGENGVLNGKWIQNYSAELPWIIGFYDEGKRTGKWAEYYKGTNHLCRTEYWENDKLNGVRTRFNMEGEIIEEILFQDGEAVVKTNYDLDQGLKWVRTPIDSNLVWTEVYNNRSVLVAKGRESIYNPGNLLWFQNIELTVLNTFSIASNDNQVATFGSQSNGLTDFQAPPLVNYKKEGDWIYYRDNSVQPNSNSTPDRIRTAFSSHFQDEIDAALGNAESVAHYFFADFVRISYEENIPVAYEYDHNLQNCVVSWPEERPGCIIPLPNPLPNPWFENIVLTIGYFVPAPAEMKSYKSLKAWEKAKNDLYVFSLAPFYTAKLEDSIEVETAQSNQGEWF